MTDPLLVVAPMEGLTGFPFRRVHAHFFGAADAYFLPFVTPTHCQMRSPLPPRRLS